jgi:alpha-L-rhamnosidase
MNLLVGFRAVFSAPKAAAGQRVGLRIAGSSLYRAFINGQFCAHGPARAAHGFYRVDEWDITAKLAPGRNVLAIEVAGYNVNSYYLLDQASFLQAEIVAGDRVLASTAGKGARLRARVLTERVQKVQRYSYQRPFMEVWRPRPGFDRWRSQADARFEAQRLSVTARKRLVPRRVPPPDFHLRQPVGHLSSGKLRTGISIKKLWKDRSLTNIGPGLKGFREEELELIPSLELQRMASSSRVKLDQLWDPEEVLRLAAGTYHIMDFGTDLTGFPRVTVSCKRRARLFLVFDELLTKDGDVNFRRMDCVNAMLYELPAGSFDLEAFEPYTLRYLKLIALGGDCQIRGVSLREYIHPGTGGAQFAAADGRLNRIFEAGRETFRQNATDIFMDCPSRERAGWLCDSFFTARAAVSLCGDTLVERNFLENYLLPRKFPHLPAGMLPMCYPADHFSGNFIPNWALWFVVQLEEYLARSGDRTTVDALRGRVLKLFDYFKPFRNSTGLLEKLESWVFIEWSRANDFVQDVNYPSNMLYAGALDAGARLYRLPRLADEARRVRAAVGRQSFDGEFFVDNAVREGRRLKVTRNRTEVCQYFAFFFGVATPRSRPRLWQRLCRDFGPGRKATGRYSQVHAAAPFIGNVLRLELLSRWGRAQQVLDESVDYLSYMAERTGTLWEMADETASCNHGFAAHVCHALYRDVLGLYRVDPVSRSVQLRFSKLKLPWCRGAVPVPGGEVRLEWRRHGRGLRYRLAVPAGYRVGVENRSELTLTTERGAKR